MTVTLGKSASRAPTRPHRNRLLSEGFGELTADHVGRIILPIQGGLTVVSARRDGAAWPACDRRVQPGGLWGDTGPRAYRLHHCTQPLLYGSRSTCRSESNDSAEGCEPVRPVALGRPTVCLACLGVWRVIPVLAHAIACVVFCRQHDRSPPADAPQTQALPAGQPIAQMIRLADVLTPRQGFSRPEDLSDVTFAGEPSPSSRPALTGDLGGNCHDPAGAE